MIITQKGKALLEQKITAAHEKLKLVMSQKGDAYENGGNGWHDNFSYEQLIREETMIAGELSSLSNILAKATIISNLPQNTEEVGIGCIVTLEDDSETSVEFEVVGYGETDTTTSPKKLEYLAPIIQPIMGCHVCDETTMRIGGKKSTYTIINIRSR